MGTNRRNRARRHSRNSKGRSFPQVHPRSRRILSRYRISLHSWPLVPLGAVGLKGAHRATRPRRISGSHIQVTRRSHRSGFWAGRPIGRAERSKAGGPALYPPLPTAVKGIPSRETGHGGTDGADAYGHTATHGTDDRHGTRSRKGERRRVSVDSIATTGGPHKASSIPIPPALHGSLGGHRVRLVTLNNTVKANLFCNSDRSVRLTNPSVLLTCLINNLTVFVVIHTLDRVTIRSPGTNTFDCCTAHC